MRDFAKIFKMIDGTLYADDKNRDKGMVVNLTYTEDGKNHPTEKEKAALKKMAADLMKARSVNHFAKKLKRDYSCENRA
jgi:hypothetical protein